jgi:hypothetical protein
VKGEPGPFDGFQTLDLMPANTHNTSRIGTQLLFWLSPIARLSCILFGVIALAAFDIFGSLSFEMFSGFLAFAAAVIPASRPDSTDQRSTTILTLAVLAITCQIADVIEYYWLHNIPGNYYAWPASIAAFSALAVMALYGGITRARQKHAV